MATQHEQFTNPSFLQKLAMDLIRSRKSNYVQDCMYYYYQESKFIMEQLYDVKNKYNNALKCTLVKHRLSLLEKVQQDFVLSHNSKKSQQKVDEKCIIYLHGLGSNRIEGFTILPHMPKSYCLVSFDLSGSGKSEGEWTTYGWREREDVQSVMAYLYQKKGMRQFVVWGRSMGAVAALLFNNMMGQFRQGKNQLADIDKETLQKQEIQVEGNGNGNKHYVQLGTLYDCVKCIVADSPFCSFESISKDIALKKMSIPTFFTQIALKFLQNTFSKLLYDNKVKKTFTPFQIDFEKNPLKPCVPTIVVYSLNDEVVGCEHSQKIISSIDRQKFKLIDKVIIPQCGHNLKRPENVMEVIFQKVQRNLAIGKRDGKVNSNSEKVNDKDKILEKSGKAVRRKSFWNFEEDLLQLQKNIDNQKQKERQDKNYQNGESCQQNKFSAQINNEKSTVRRSIFARDQKCSNESKIPKKANGTELAEQKRGSSITRKRGLSLSSTIQRMEGSTRMNTQSNFINSKKVEGSIPQHSNSIQLDQSSIKNSLPNRQLEKENTKAVQRLRNFSMDVRKSSRQEQEQQQSRMSPRKGINRCSLKLMNKNFEDSSRKRPSLGGVRNSSCNRVVLGGQKAKGTLDRVSKMMGTSLCSQSFIPAEKDSNRENQFSTISYSSQSIHQTNTLISRQMPRSQPCILDSLLSEPNMGPSEVLDQRGYKKCSSRQSLKTIDVGQMHGKNSVDEQLQAFINNKLQFNFDKRNWDQGVFNKYKTIDFGNAENQIIQVKGNNNKTINDSEKSSVTRKSIELGGSPGKRRMQSRNKTKQSIILSQIDPKQFTQFNELNQEQIAKVSKLSIPSHITLRPSSRLYHEKRKKKLQGQVNSFNRQNENFVKITNQRYLAED